MFNKPPQRKRQLEAQERSEPVDFLMDLWNFLRERKKWWLLPVIIVLLLLGILIIIGGSSAVAPFIYTIF